MRSSKTSKEFTMGEHTIFFNQREWVNTTVGEVFDFYKREALASGKFLHITPMREERRAVKIEYLVFPPGHSLQAILAKLMDESK